MEIYLSEIPVELIEEILFYLEPDDIYNLQLILDINLRKPFYQNKLKIYNINIKYLDYIYEYTNNYFLAYSYLYDLSKKYLNTWHKSCNNSWNIPTLNINISFSDDDLDNVIDTGEIYNILLNGDIKKNLSFVIGGSEESYRITIRLWYHHAEKKTYVKYISNDRYYEIFIDAKDIVEIIIKLLIRGYDIIDTIGNSSYCII